MHWKSFDVIDALSQIMISRGCPEYIHSDNGAEFTANKLHEWLREIGVITAYIEPGSPWENGYCESFNSRMCDEFLNGELFGSLREAEVLTKHWVDYYNTLHPHSSLRGRVPQTIISAYFHHITFRPVSQGYTGSAGGFAFLDNPSIM